MQNVQSQNQVQDQCKMASLRENRDLREFEIENVHQTEGDRVLGTGSYGTVEAVQLQLTFNCRNL